MKFILIMILSFYLLYRIGGFFMRILFGLGGQQNRQFQQNRQNQTNVNNNKSNVEKPNKKGYTGGEYVDYEEID